MRFLFSSDVKRRKGVATLVVKIPTRTINGNYQEHRVDAQLLQMYHVENISNVATEMNNSRLNVESRWLRKHRFNE